MTPGKYILGRRLDNIGIANIIQCIIYTNTLMSKTRQQRKMRNRKKTIKRFKGGLKPRAQRLERDCRILKELTKFFLKAGGNAEFTRLYNNSDDKLYEYLDRLQRLSPYAYIQVDGCPNTYLLVKVTEYVTMRDMFPHRILTDTIIKTIAENDVELINADTVCRCVSTLLFGRTRNLDVSSVFKDDIRLLLTAIPPANIRKDCWRWLYGGVIRRFDFNTLESLILGGHIPNTKADYDRLLDNLEEMLRMREKSVEYKSQYSQEQVDKFVELFKVLKPRNIYNTTNMIYMLQNTGTPLNADNVEELHSYLPVEEAADDGDE